MTDQIMVALSGIETALQKAAERADNEARELGKVSTETKNALEKFGTEQRELADRLLSLEQRGLAPANGIASVDTWGSQLVKASALSAFQSGQTNKCSVEVKNTMLGSDATVAPDRKPGIVPGASQILTLEALLPSLPTSSNAIEYTKENVFTNAANGTAEGGVLPESSITYTLVNMPVSTVGHFIKISEQLSKDNAALAAYVNQRMVYGVDLKVETALATGAGGANLSGIFNAGNYTAHGYLSGALGSVLAKCVLIRKSMADLRNAGYIADAILLNPTDWANIEIELLTTNAGQVPFRYDAAGTPILFGVPVVQSGAVTADTFAVGAFRQAGVVHNREGVTIELSGSDGTNFTSNLVTIKANRRLALAIEVPAAIRGGDLTPPSV
ncbi:phage major capsid protein [Lysobacter korlensis]|uniref:Phage major capsid protein n=1 Tax=Lysobacter korlensis TaxID=553636 RepID=A0ABV6RKL6_9GAMM